MFYLSVDRLCKHVGLIPGLKMSGRAPPASGPAGGPAGTRFTELAGRGGRLPTDKYGNRYKWRRGLPREAESSLLFGRGGGQAALLPKPAAAGRLPAYPGPSQSPSPNLLITRPPASADGRRTLSHPITKKKNPPNHRTRVVIRTRLNS